MFHLTKEEFLQLKSSLIFQIGISNQSCKPRSPASVTAVPSASLCLARRRG